MCCCCNLLFVLLVVTLATSMSLTYSIWPSPKPSRKIIITLDRSPLLTLSYFSSAFCNEPCLPSLNSTPFYSLNMFRAKFIWERNAAISGGMYRLDNVWVPWYSLGTISVITRWTCAWTFYRNLWFSLTKFPYRNIPIKNSGSVKIKLFSSTVLVSKLNIPCVKNKFFPRLY